MCDSRLAAITSDKMNPTKPTMIKNIPMNASGGRTKPWMIQSTITAVGIASIVPTLCVCVCMCVREL